MPAVGFVLVGDDSGDARAEHELDLCERPDESGAQCRIGVVDGTDLIERDPRSEVVAAAMGRFLKVWLELNKMAFWGSCCGIPGWRLRRVCYKIASCRST